MLLPTDHNKLLLQWKGPFVVTEAVNRCDYKINSGGKSRIYHANLLKQYVERKDDERDVAALAVIEPGEETDEAVDDENLLELHATEAMETYRDVRINPNLTKDQREDVQSFAEGVCHHLYGPTWYHQPGSTPNRND